MVTRTKSNKVQVLAEVKSYNVVEYLKKVFSYLGYCTDEDVLNASDFGVPQRRHRFMIMGIKKNKLNGQKVKLPDKIFSELHTTREAIGDLEKIPPYDAIENYEPKCYIETYNNLTALQRYYRKDSDSGIIYNHINTKSRELSLKRFEAIKDTGGKNFHSLSDELKTTYADASRTQNTIYLRLKI